MANEIRRVLLTKRKPTTKSEDVRSMPPPKQVGTSNIEQSLRQAADVNAASVSPHPDLGAPSIKRETSHPARDDRVKSESRSQSPRHTMASTSAQREASMPTSSASTQPAAKSINYLISSMVDTTAYAQALAKSPSVPRDTTKGDEQLLQKLVTQNGAFQFATAATVNRDSLQHPEDFPERATTFVTTSASNSEERHARQDNAAVAAGTAKVAAHSSDLPSTDTGSSRRGSRAPSSSPSTQHPRGHQRSPKTSHKPKPSNAKPSTPLSLYPGPSATMTPSDLQNNTSAKKRSRLARSEHPERFLYAGNTFSNLDERSFHETAEKNPYLFQLTSDATRPVYKTPLEARRALKEAENSPDAVVAPIDYDQLIKELTDTIAEFRMRYEKSKAMTAKAGIQVEDNVWDRLSNMVQYPPDFDSYAQKGQDLSKYAEEMKAWDRAIGHQVIIKKRIVYKEAIEKLQVKLDIVQAEKGFDTHNTNLKRKAEEDAEHDEEAAS